MNKIIWNSKIKSWRWIAINTGKSMVYFLFSVKFNLRYKQWFAYIHTPLIGFCKNNSMWSISLCFGKNYIEILYHF